jgi:hypothetical protein
MSLSPIIGAASQVLNLFGGSSPATGSTTSTSTDPSNGNVDLSQAAQFFSKLQDLSQTDSTQFKQLTAQIASQLQTDAQSATGSEQSFLNNLSNQFNTASQTGSASGLHPHHGHHTPYEQPTDSQSLLQNVFQQVPGL